MKTDTTEMERLLDRDAVVDVITRLFVSTDEKDWPAVERCFAERVRFDMSSAGGGPPRTVPPAEIASGWKEGLAAMDAIHHQAGNFRVRVEGDRATAACYGIAYHYRERAIGGRTRVFVGSYDFELERESDWRITAMRFSLKFIDGNEKLEAGGEG